MLQKECCKYIMKAFLLKADVLASSGFDPCSLVKAIKTNFLDVYSKIGQLKG